MDITIHITSWVTFIEWSIIFTVAGRIGEGIGRLLAVIVTALMSRAWETS